MKKTSVKAPLKQAPTTPPIAPEKLQLLVTVVNREKAEFYTDLLHSFEINLHLSLLASGTASTEMLNLLGLSDTEKSVLFSVVREDKAKLALAALDEKFRTIRNGKGIAYTIPMTGTIGVAIYRFLANIQD